jgi:hypothetical protein
MRHLPFAFLALSSLALATGCRTMKMDVAPSLESQALPVHKSGGLFDEGEVTFGEFAAIRIHRGWTRSSSMQIFGYESTKSKQKFRFAFAKAGVADQQMRCETVFAEKALHRGRVTFSAGEHGLGCELRGPGGAPVGELMLAGDDRPAGYLQAGNVVVEMVATGRFEGGSWENPDPVGFDLLVSGQVVGAVQTINGGRVWLERSAPAEIQDTAALAAATLLLFQTLDG